MKAVIALYPDYSHARKVVGKLKESGFSLENLSLLAHRDTAKAGRLIISHAKSGTRIGMFLGVVIGAILGFMGGILLFSTGSSEIPLYIFGLMGLIPTSVLGGYLGSLYGARDVTYTEMNIKESLANEDSVLLVANITRENELTAFNILRETNGEFVETHEIDAGQFKSLASDQ